MELRTASRSRRRGHKRRWLIGAIVVLAVLVSGITIVSVALQPVNDARNTVTKLAVKQNKITKVTDFHHISRQKTYNSIIGVNKKHQKVGVIMTGSSKKLVTIKMADGLSETKVRQLIQSDYHPKRITSMGLAMYKQVPVWDVTFLDRQGNVNLITYQFSDGKKVRTIQHL